MTSIENLNVDIRYKEDLSKYTTFRLGGTCKGLINCQSPKQLIAVIKKLNSVKKPFILIGGGSNLVVSDEGIDCYVVRFVSDVPIIERNGNELIVSASTSLDALALYAAKEGLKGLNCTSGIPGTVGGAVVGNAGAFGKQIGDVIESIEVITREAHEKQLFIEDCQFSYRHSHLKETGDIVLSVRLSLESGKASSLLKERDEILSIRQEKHPNLELEPCAGSFFRNVEPTSKAGKRQAAGWFLEQADGKELKHGGAHIFSKHANIIVKGHGCSSQDVYELHKNMSKLVKEKFSLNLIREVRFVGEFKGMPQSAKNFKNPIW